MWYNVIMRWKRKNHVVLEKHKWHRWFAWKPVRIHGPDTYTTVWLETVMRKGEYITYPQTDFDYWKYEYRMVGGIDNLNES